MERPNNILDVEERQINVNAMLVSNGVRFANYLIDMIIFYLLFIVFFVIYFSINIDAAQAVDSLDDNPGTELFFNFIGIIGLVVYYTAFEATLGKTPGKFITRTRVVNMEGRKPSFQQILGRSFCRLIPFEPFSFFSNEGVGWHDSIPNTRVIADKDYSPSDYV